MSLTMRLQPEKVALKEAAIRNLACQECGGEILPDAMFCGHCHAPIVRRYCAKCSQLVPENSAFCPFCGTSAKEVIPERFSLLTRIVPIAACLVLLMIFVGRQDRTVKRTASQKAVENIAGSGGEGFVASLKQGQALPVVRSEAPANGPDAGRRLNVQAHELMKTQRYAEAIPLLLQSIQAFGYNSKDEALPYALFNLAQSFRITGKPEKALPILEKLNETNPNNPMFEHELEAARNALGPKTVPTAALY